MAQRSFPFVLALGGIVVGFLACSGSTDTQRKDPGEPLRVAPASAALCGGGATRESDGSDPGAGAAGPGGGSGSYDAGASGGYAGSAGTGGYAGTGGTGGTGGTSGAGGSGGSGELDAGPDADADAEVPDADIPDACDPDAEGGTCEPDADVEGGVDGGEDAEADAEPDAGDGGTKAMSLGTKSESNLCEGVDLQNPLKLYLSADDSNSMASPVIVRSMIESGRTVDPWVVRTYEFLNYYRFDFAPAAPGQLAVTSQLGSCVLSSDFALQIAVASEPAPEARRAMNLVLVLDTSGSMDGSPIALERQTVLALASSLQAGDVVSAVTWNTEQSPVLAGHVASGPDDPVIVDLANSIQASGGTDLHAGLMAGYQLAEANYKSDGINRMVLVSDGQANVGLTDENLIGEKAEDRDSEGIYLVGVGVGDGFNDTLMDTVTDAGRGAYIFIDSAEEARRMFVDRFAESVLVAAREVQVELTLPPYFNIKKFYGEQYSPDPAKVRPQHMAPDDTLVFYQILHPCDPSLPRADDPYQVRVSWKDPLTGQDKEVVESTTLGALDLDDGNLTKATAVIGYAELLKRLADLPSADDRRAAIAETRDVVVDANTQGNDPDLLEIQGLLSKLYDAQ